MSESEQYNSRIEKSTKWAEARVHAKYGTVKRAKQIYLLAQSGSYVSPGFYFDLAIACLKKAGFEIDEAD